MSESPHTITVRVTDNGTPALTDSETIEFTVLEVNEAPTLNPVPDQEITVGKRVAVVGGGNVALDVAGAARRYGATVTIVYRRSREEMPAFSHEIEQATCEGVEIE